MINICQHIIFTLWIFHTVFYCWHIGCFHILCVTNNTAINIFRYIFLGNIFMCSVGTYMRVELLGQKICVWLRDTAKYFSKKVLVLVYILIIVSKNSSCASSALSELTWFVSLYNGSRSIGWVMVSHCGEMFSPTLWLVFWMFLMLSFDEQKLLILM